MLLFFFRGCGLGISSYFTTLNSPKAGQDDSVSSIRAPGVEALRALAALLVLSSHLLGPNLRLPDFLRNFGAGRGGVLLFFVISGYVIGLTNRKPWSQVSIRDYWRRRFRRLAPLYILAVLFSLGIACIGGRSPSLAAAAGHVLCLQNIENYLGISIQPVSSNPALWTVNYEMVFYALFLVVWSLRPTAFTVFGTCAALTLAGFILPTSHFFVLSYATGFIFWLSGLALAWGASKADPLPDGRFPLLGLALLLFVTHHAAPLSVALDFAGVDFTQLPWINIGDLALVPVCVLLVGAGAGVIRRPGVISLLLCVVPPLATVGAALSTGHSLSEGRWAVAALTSVLGATLIWSNVGTASLLQRLAPWGAISYAVYLFHYPIHELFLAWSPNGLLSVIIPSFIVTIAVALFLEHRFQPWCLGLIKRKRTQPGISI